MPATTVRLLAFALLMLMIVGCVGRSNSGGSGGGDNPTVVTFSFKGPMPIAVAAKIGSGAFAPQTLSSSKLSLSIPSGTTQFAVAGICPPLSQTVGSLTVTSSGETVWEATPEDGTEFTTNCSDPVSNPTTGALTGSVDASAIEGVNTIGLNVATGDSTGETFFLSGESSTFDVAPPSGIHRVAVGAYVNAATSPYGTNFVYRLAALRNFDGVAVPGTVNGGETIVLGATDAVTAQEPITYKELPNNYGAPNTFAFYEWKDGGGVWLTNGASSEYPAVPSAATEAGDYYAFTVGAYNQSKVGEGMVISANSANAGPQTFTFPAPWAYAGPIASPLPSFDVSYAEFAGKNGVVDEAGISWQVDSGNTTRYSYQVLASANYLKGSTTLAFPDLSSVPGFLTPAASGTSVAWWAGIIQSSNGFLQPSSGGGNTSSVQNSGTFTVP